MMKIAISVPDPIFRKAEKFRRRLRLARSTLYGKALQTYLESFDSGEVTEALNAVYPCEPSEVPKDLLRMQLASLPKEDW